jgi:DNA-directed RNA polymerase subunit RPC12/RpoP
MKISPWKTAWFCSECKEQLNWKDKYNSYGRCPYCGYKNLNSNTFVKSFERGYREIIVDSPPWWKFWVKPTIKIEYKED